MQHKESGFLAIWHGVEAPSDATFHLWHARVHMPERIVVPGITAARRYIAVRPTKLRYFTLYDGESAAVFGSPEYLYPKVPARQWDADVRKSFTNFTRVVCDSVATSGYGVGGALATVIAQIAPPIDTTRAEALCRTLTRLPGLILARLGVNDTAVTRASRLRPLPLEPQGNVTLVLEGVRAADLDEALPEVARRLQVAFPGAQCVDQEVYTLSHLLKPNDPDATDVAEWVRNHDPSSNEGDRP